MWASCLALSALALVGAAPATAQAVDARPEVQWYLANFPPSSIQSGPLKAQGYLDRILEQVIWPALPQFRHKLVVAPPSRMVQDAAHQPNVCSPSMAKTPERQATYHLSSAVFRFLPAGLAMRRADSAELSPWLTPQGEVDLERLLHERVVSLGVVGTRRHGAAVDGALARHPDRLLVLNTTQANITLLRMLALNRAIDGSLSYGFEIPCLTAQYPELAGQLVWYPVRGQPTALTNHIACSRSELGAQVIGTLDAALRHGSARPQAQRLFEEWLDPDSRRTLERQRREAPEHFWQDANP